MSSIISIQGLSVSYERKRVLTNIFLEVEAGFLYGVIGPNGAGKSTLFKAILGLTAVNSGMVSVKGKTIQEVRKEVVYVPQKSEVDWTFPATVMDIVLMGRYPHKKPFQRLNKGDMTLAMSALEKLGIENLKHQQIGELSGGQQQRVFIARALCQEAEIYLLDEPLVGVDITTEEKIVVLLNQLASEGKTILVVHHDLPTVPEYFDKIIMINHHLVAAGDTAMVFTPENITRAYGAQSFIMHETGRLG